MDTELANIISAFSVVSAILFAYSSILDNKIKNHEKNTPGDNESKAMKKYNKKGRMLKSLSIGVIILNTFIFVLTIPEIIKIYHNYDFSFSIDCEILPVLFIAICVMQFLNVVIAFFIFYNHKFIKENSIEESK